MIEQDDVKWLRQQLHSPEMRCRQCDLTRQILDEFEQIVRGRLAAAVSEFELVEVERRG